VNRFGLVYTVEGWDSSLQPILLTAHQDVVPVENSTLDEWDYPPFSGHYDESSGYIYGRGASDDKSAITALMTALEALLSQKNYYPRRTVVFAFGFDEEYSGTLALLQYPNISRIDTIKMESLLFLMRAVRAFNTSATPYMRYQQYMKRAISMYGSTSPSMAGIVRPQPHTRL
jgi:arginine utilization protein RocB